MYTKDLDTLKKVEQIFTYLLSIKNMNKKTIKNISEYEKVYYECELPKGEGCYIYKENCEDCWLEVTDKCKNLYDSLSRLYLYLEKNSENVEITWGHAILSWKINNSNIIHPIFTTKMDLTFDTKSSKFILKPYNNYTNIELEILEDLPIKDINKILDLRDNFNSLGIDPRNIEEYEDILKQIYQYLTNEDLNSENILKKELISIKNIKPEKKPLFYNASCIIVRSIDTRLWNMEIKNVLEELKKDYPIPKTIQALVKNEYIPQDKDTINNWKPIGENLLFPLPANEEQKEIAKRLSENFGVVVQGPPGTGKSHTIVNLISHLLAHGKRVLVTSQTDRALRVLSNKIPKNINSLCISILGNDSKSLKELDESVRKITENLSLDPNEIYKEILPLENKLASCRKIQEKLYDKLEKIEHLENNDIIYLGKSHKLINMSKWISENEKKYSWIIDDVDPKSLCPITDNEFNKLISLLKSIDNDYFKLINEIDNIITNLPPYEELNEKLLKLIKHKNEYINYKENIKGWNITNNFINANEILLVLDETIETMENIEKSWLANVMKYYYFGEVSKPIWKQLISNCNDYLYKISNLKQYLSNFKIEVPKSMDIDVFYNDFKPIYNTLKTKGKLGSFFKLFHSSSNYILENCKVDYNKISNLEQADVINKYIKKQILERKLRNLWNNTVKEYGGKILNSSDINSIANLENLVRQIENIIHWDDNVKSKIIKLLDGIHLPHEFNWYEKETYIYLKTGILSIKNIKEFYDLKVYFENIRKLLTDNEHLKDLDKAIEEHDIDAIDNIYHKFDKLKLMKPKIDEINYLINKLKNKCPLLANDILTNKNLDLDKLVDFTEAWKWTQWNNIIKKVHESDINSIEENLREEKIREKSIIEELVGKRTWYNQMIRTTESQKRSLFSWMESIKRIGKGTGKNVIKYRKIAQKEMENCKDVIPVWIMPLNRVIENIKLSKNLFDVVIFDESSQSDLSAISALLRAEKAVIVGDEKQISPEVVGKDNSKVESLINKYLSNIPHSEWFDLSTSLYNTALRVFPNRLLLKEHFRCVPEIIEFSNNLCYSGEILPLRCAESKEIFNPSVITVKVEDGLRDSSKPINIKEAEAIVNQIVKCCKSEKYKNMTMGVISLLSNVQSEIIENMLTEKLGIEEMVNRKLICGDAYSFQGDERDVMFLSLVIANNAKFNALTKNSDIRRFNVAASRARNQLWLFHSVDLEDLNPKCVRAELLKYCTNPIKNNLQNKQLKYPLLTSFQKDVYNIIKNTDYKIIPNFKIGKYMVDFLIINKDKKIALQCDGDKFNLINMWKNQYERQMSLEKIGWTFFTIRGTEFYRNQEKTLDKLYKILS